MGGLHFNRLARSDVVTTPRWRLSEPSAFWLIRLVPCHTHPVRDDDVRPDGTTSRVGRRDTATGRCARRAFGCEVVTSMRRNLRSEVSAVSLVKRDDESVPELPLPRTLLGEATRALADERIRDLRGV